ncbi:uncharacterized protein LOC124271980 isoform X1 [Haliotis rubra]|uniref:uncharacterized protein LOC124271980 isoform X1 n=2 Tax=Haliotis rubra TaxID=36100 RepID=UPI001EE55581|nr:uncharacterized protein LOC124271980 isoform X1 [Haliotis rubra]
MSTMLFLLVSLSCLAAVTAQGTPCCMASKWSATMSDIQAIASGNMVTSNYYYDSDNMATAIQYYEFGTPTPVLRNRVVTSYSKNVRYNIDADGTCTKEDISDTMVPKCIPATATYLGSNYVGTEENGLKYDGWQIPLGSLNITVSFSNPDCIPIVQAVTGTASSSPVNLALFFNGYKVGITNPAAFDVPISC